MRDIKFRAWVKEGKYNPHHKPYMATQGDDDIETLQSFMHHYSDEPILMQYIGRKDKNGRDIYEGDIIGMKINDKIIPAWIVETHNGYTCFGTKQISTKKRTVSPVSISFWSRYEVIGNIYETPELLNNQTQIK